MRVLITGGAGFIGSHLAERLLAGGHEVAVLDDLSTGSMSNIDHLIGRPGFGHRLGSHVWGEAELGVAGREHTVVPGVLPPGIDDPTLSIAWLSYSIVFRFTAGRFEPFVAFGIGSGQADLEVTADQPFTVPALQIDSDRGLLVQYRVGFDVAISHKNCLGLDLRRIDFDADLGAFTNGETDIGGTAVLLTYRHTWGMESIP